MPSGLMDAMVFENAVAVVLLLAGSMVATSSSCFAIGAATFGSLCFATLRPIYGASPGVRVRPWLVMACVACVRGGAGFSGARGLRVESWGGP